MRSPLLRFAVLAVAFLLLTGYAHDFGLSMGCRQLDAYFGELRGEWLRQQRAEQDALALQPEAEKGDADAQYLLALSYLQQDRIAEALRWICLAANQGHANAQDRLGDAYRGDPSLSGDLPHDAVKAYLWYSLAIFNFERQGGFPFSERSREDLARNMTPAQIAEAEKLVAEWKPGSCELKSAAVSK